MSKFHYRGKDTKFAQQFAEGGAVGDDYNTTLSASDEAGYSDWKAKNAPDDSGADYDLRGAYKAGETPAENGHFVDTFKKPNHPTFSDESQYATPGTNPGHWGGANKDQYQRGGGSEGGQ